MLHKMVVANASLYLKCLLQLAHLRVDAFLTYLLFFAWTLHAPKIGGKGGTLDMSVAWSSHEQEMEFGVAFRSASPLQSGEGERERRCHKRKLYRQALGRSVGRLPSSLEINGKRHWLRSTEEPKELYVLILKERNPLSC